MGRPLDLHAGIVDEDVHTAITVQDLFGHILDTADVREVQEDQLWGECLLNQRESQGMCGKTSLLQTLGALELRTNPFEIQSLWNDCKIKMKRKEQRWLWEEGSCWRTHSWVPWLRHQ